MIENPILFFLILAVAVLLIFSVISQGAALSMIFGGATGTALADILLLIMERDT